MVISPMMDSLPLLCHTLTYPQVCQVSPILTWPWLSINIQLLPLLPARLASSKVTTCQSINIYQAVTMMNTKKRKLLIIFTIFFSVLPILYLVLLHTPVTISTFSARLQHIHAVCAAEKRIHISRPSDHLHWSVEPDSQLLMCRTAKHGSTSWAAIFVRIYTQGLAGYLDRNGI